MINFAESKEENMDLTNKEKDLKEQLRNYRRAYPNGARMLEREILDLVYELMEGEDEQDDSQDVC